LSETPGSVASILQPLIDAAGADRVRPADPAADAVEGVVPRLVAAPADEEALARVLAFCHRHRLAVAPRGGGTQLELGGIPERLDVLVDVTPLARIVQYEPADLTVTVQAGMRLGELQAELGRRGQFLPVDPPTGGEATIGGLLATAASGPLRTGYSHLRDRLLGMRVVRADGTIVRSGGRVVKNVAGYDMGRLHTGALGTLGVIVEATFKVQPLPEAWGCVQVGPLAPEAAVAPAAALEALLAALLDAPAQPVLLEVLGPPARVLVGYAGVAAEVDFAVAEALRIAKKVLGSAGQAAAPVSWDAAHAETLAAHRSGDDAMLTLRLHGPSSQAATLLEQVVREAAAAGVPCRYAAHAAVGTLRVHLGAAADQALEGLVQSWLPAVRRWGGNLVVERAPLPLKRAIPVWGEPPPALFLMRALKEKFDPHRILNPGRYVGGL